MREAHTEVLVVGAGPVGLWTALLLAEAGVQVQIIDQETRTTTRSYACALHPATLALFDRFGLTQPLLAAGRPIEKIAFYDRQGRRAELKIADPQGKYPCLLILPQNVLEEALEQRLQKTGVKVQWNHRFDSLIDEPEIVAAMVEELGGTGTGYIVPHWENVVKGRSPIRAQFLVGADGANSLVRQRLGFDFERAGGPEFFAAYEFEADQPAPHEVRIILDQTTDVLWPLAGNKCRWTFQLERGELEMEYPQKERRSARMAQTSIDERIRDYVQKIAAQRAPWFTAELKQLNWCTEVVFEHRVVRQFGRNRCWLVGDAGHQTGPAGVQSMNAGFSEAAKMTEAIKRILHEAGPFSLLEIWQEEQRTQWRDLLGMTGELQPKADANPWFQGRCKQVLPCLPGHNPVTIRRLAAQLRLDWNGTK